MHARLSRPGESVIAGLAAVALLATLPAPGSRPALTRLIVRADAGAAVAAQAVLAVGGRVLSELPLIGGVVADVPAGSPLPAGVNGSPDRTVSLRSTASPDGSAVSTVRATLGLPADGVDGGGITVAVVDTGVADVVDLAGAVEHVDLTGGGPGDGYGHGTFMAGLIAGTGTSSGGAYRGVAPAARILDVKVADSAGNTSLIAVLQGLEVVAKHPEVRVLNLSLSSDSPLPYQADPLTRALDALWARGVVVVVPAGNDGPGSETVTSPGNDPTLITVGGLDENATAARADDVIAAWSSRGPAPQGVAKPDLGAPGSHLISLRAPGSAIDEGNPGSRVGDAYFRGSGTSMATAVTSGAVAALLAARPGLRPAQVKALVTGTAYAADGLRDAMASGAGGLDVRSALSAPVPVAARLRGPKSGDLPRWMEDDEAAMTLLAQAWAAGDYDATARAWAQLSPQGRAWSARAWAMEVWAQSAGVAESEWAGRAWSGRAWSAAELSGTEWLGRAWSARAWSGDDWVGRAWSGRAWSGQAWTGRAWSGQTWNAQAWGGRAWSGRAWSGQAWSGRAWSARSWSARSWSARDWS